MKDQGDAIHRALAEAIEHGLKPDSDDRHHALQNRFHACTKEVYIGLSRLYTEHTDFKRFFDVYHPDMIAFIGDAMRFYAQMRSYADRKYSIA